MATFELTLLAAHLNSEQISAVRRALDETGAAPLDEDDTAEPIILDRDIDDDCFYDFRDRLDANDAAADIYLPTDFEDIINLSEHRVGSAHALLLVLESLREDFHIEEDMDSGTEEEAPEEGFESLDEQDELLDEPEEDDAALGGDESSTEMKDEQLRHIWKQLHRGATLSIRQGLCMFLR